MKKASRSDKEWTEEEEECLRRNKDKLSYGQIAERLERSTVAVMGKARKMDSGFDISEKDLKKGWTEEEDGYLRRNADILGCGQVAQNLGRSFDAVRGRITTLGLTTYREREESRKAKEEREREIDPINKLMVDAGKPKLPVRNLYQYWQRLLRDLPGYFRCEACRMVEATQIHHIKARCRGGDDSAHNLSLLCGGCHNAAPMLREEFQHYCESGGAMESVFLTWFKVGIDVILKRGWDSKKAMNWWVKQRDEFWPDFPRKN